MLRVIHTEWIKQKHTIKLNLILKRAFSSLLDSSSDMNVSLEKAPSATKTFSIK